MQKIKQTSHWLWNFIRHHPWRSSLLFVALFIVVATGISLLPRTIQFSYAGVSCVNKVTLLPGTLKSTSEEYELSVDGVISIGSINLLARKVCATPNEAPSVGTYDAGLSVASISAYNFRIVVPETPSVTLDVVKKPIAAAQAITLPLSTHDEVFEYVLASDSKSVVCEPKDGGVECDTVGLQLQQGEEQPLAVERHFKSKKVATLFSDTVTVLPAVQIKESSPKNEQTVYTKGEPFTFTVDKPLEKASATLVRHEKEKDSTVAYTVETKVEGNTITVTPSDKAELPRDAEYTLTLESVSAEDGSGLAGPHAVRFKLSGGPKVASVSVGTSGTAPSARIALKLDQKRKSSQDITKLVKVEGVQATVTATEDTIYVALPGTRCASVSITVDKGLISEHDITSTEGWSFKTRTQCYTVETIGYSVRGRAINAYVFGSGSTTYLFTGAIHGNELSSNYTMRNWMDDLEANPQKIPSKARVVVVPSANPDGVAGANRLNANGVNLNRNFPTHNWESDIITGTGAHKGGGGSSAGSEPETRALINATSRYAPHFVITHHSSGSLVNSNDAGVSITAGRRYASLAGYSFVPNSATTGKFGFEMTGTYEDWLLERGVAAILIELNTDTGNHYARNQSAMWAMLQY